MNRIPVWVFLISFSLLLQATMSEEEDVKLALLIFYTKLSNNNGLLDPALGWNTTSDPCRDRWKGIVCDNSSFSVKKISLDGLNFSGIFDASTLCNVQSLAASLTVLSLNNNNLREENLDAIGNCRQLTHLYISGNQFFGSLPNSLSRLNNLKRLDISHNKFSGSLPDLVRTSGLIELLAQNNQLSGAIPEFDFANLDAFNVSNNQLSGPIPLGGARFPVSSYINNHGLCGDPLPNRCTISPAGSESLPDTANRNGGLSTEQVLMYSGYVLIGLAVIIAIILRLLCKKDRKKEEQNVAGNKVAAVDLDSFNRSSFASKEYKTDGSKSEISVASAESVLVSSSLVVLTSPTVNGLKFEDLLKAPAELLGRGRHGSVYKVLFEDTGMLLAVKRIKDWTISSNDFKQRMRRLDQVKHPNVLPALAYYCSREEKLLVYEYQQNGSLFRLLHGSQTGQALDWTSRLSIAATIAETLAFMHQELRADLIAHGNLKSSNILLSNKTEEPCISEYGLMVSNNVDLYVATEESQGGAFKEDVYGFGVILLELLTGKMVQTGIELATWVVSVVREEWTVEVFDRSLLQEGASEERLVNLLQVAVKCVDRSPEARPAMNQVALMLTTLREEEERSMDVSQP